MIRSLFSAVSGLLNHQTAMDVIGNNVSNINTVGFKASTTDFGEAFSQTARLANTTTPIGLDVGLGSRVVGTVTDYGQGAFQRTDVPSDLGISGNGFFQVTTKSTPTAGTPSGQTYLTRAGDFIVDNNGYLRTADGYYVQGYTGSTATTNGFASSTVPAGFTTPTEPSTMTSSQLSNVRIPTSIVTSGVGVTPVTTQGVSNYTIGTDGAITLVGQDGTNYTIGYVPLTVVSNTNGLNDQGGGYYITTQASGSATVEAATTGQAGTIQSGALELSNADVASQFSEMIIIQRGYDANAKVITTSNEMLQTADNLIQ